MLYFRLIKYFYSALTILAFLMPMEYGVLDFLPGLIIMWTIFIFYYYISNTNSISKQINFIENKNGNTIGFIITTFLYLFFYPLYTKFYTGTSIYSSIFSIKSGISNYAIYQAYFLDNDLNSFSISKLPYILSHSFLKLAFIFHVFTYFIYSNKINFIKIICIIIMSIIYVFVGITRGTSFEIFEIFNLFLFVYVIYRQKNNKRELLSRKSFSYLSIFIFISVSYFIFNIKQRYGGELDFTNLPGYNKQSIISIFFPTLSIFLFSLYGYFTFGLHFTSILVYKLWLNSPTGFISMFVPYGINNFNFSESSREFVNLYIDVGAKWTPETDAVIEHYGILTLIFIIIVISLFTKKLIKKIQFEPNSLIFLFFIYLYMISLPIGNFLTVSSSNKICFLLAFIATLMNKKSNYGR